jgi:hypothetical protein
MRAARGIAVATKTPDQNLSLDDANRSATGNVIDPGKFEIENHASLELDLWAEASAAFNSSYQLSCITSTYMQLAKEQEDMDELTEHVRLLVRGTKLAEC